MADKRIGIPHRPSLALGVRPARGLRLTLTGSRAAWSPLMDVLDLPNLAPPDLFATIVSK